jgi:hypothetical protein
MSSRKVGLWSNVHMLSLICRNKHDQVAFAVHAFLVADGYRLIATGSKADTADEGAHPARTASCDRDPCQTCKTWLWNQRLSYTAEIPEDKKWNSVKGWNELEDGYAFRYEDPTGQCKQGPCFRRYPDTAPRWLFFSLPYYASLSEYPGMSGTQELSVPQCMSPKLQLLLQHVEQCGSLAEQVHAIRRQA